ncbi:zinc finger and BTB domain-containing protein 40 isoform X1 [Petromyzon marinus]|uniref:Zinc finger protein 341-like isoform X1 n=1 Tax=Petromyzon marinus TaxID=7757 RepID=A0AAJ7WY32_PETMA|nr:zinc finger protein 341-like isoform X1 [Petromyzon marinus]XP_032814308.1 zinc finger protein 341-like isoform X1 [Petromyzon marinus]XP_032814309.1 zinc finger protein 341-like isoform X1 [Petromyzon marinus]XP_032814310.1 zinc finger protein 341-like isoform X1 [Petromyzon marinus]XP_032814311.1 zinc finger protein 341-like isoform X1 [Petromyzon marinus]XP_032814312.1 zinc finger protein 341-like isoform X1 [Petromyzon marinus]XP_032814313.1 zinc finger protein 341-like isoform X1 [Pet
MELPNYAHTLLRRLSALRRQQRLCDVTLVAGRVAFRAHRAVLAAASPALLGALLLEADAATLSVDPSIATADEIALLLEVAYAGTIPPGRHNATRLVQVAEGLQMSDVADACRAALGAVSGGFTAPQRSDAESHSSPPPIITVCPLSDEDPAAKEEGETWQFVFTDGGVASSLPVTSLPVTSIPVTSIPVTSIPVTSIPVTSIPVMPSAEKNASSVNEGDGTRKNPAGTPLPVTSVLVTSLPVLPSDATTLLSEPPPAVQEVKSIVPSPAGIGAVRDPEAVAPVLIHRRRLKAGLVGTAATPLTAPPTTPQQLPPSGHTTAHTATTTTATTTAATTTAATTTATTIDEGQQREEACKRGATRRKRVAPAAAVKEPVPSRGSPRSTPPVAPHADTAGEIGGREKASGPTSRKKRRKRPPIACNLCGKVFQYMAGMLYHQRSEHFAEKPFACGECGSRFAAASTLKNHERLHTGERPHTCPHCPLAFPQPAALAYHLKRKHAMGRLYSCQYCEAAFPQAVELTRHVRTHTGDRPYVCRPCGKGFSQANGLSLHLRTHHLIEEPNDCQKCHLSFPSAEEYFNHIKETHPNECFPCDHCQRTFTTPAALERHLVTHLGGKPYSCDVCCKAYQHLSGLWYHNRVHHPAVFAAQNRRSTARAGPLVCHLCDTTFDGKAAYIRHSKARDCESQPQLCGLCQAVFADSRALHNHLKSTHPGGLPFCCPSCPLSFRHQSARQYHCTTEHPVPPPLALSPPHFAASCAGPAEHAVTAPTRERMTILIIQAGGGDGGDGGGNGDGGVDTGVAKGTLQITEYRDNEDVGTADWTAAEAPMHDAAAESTAAEGTAAAAVATSPDTATHDTTTPAKTGLGNAKADETPANIATIDKTAHNITGADMTAHNIAGADITAHDVATADITAQSIPTAGITPHDIAPVDITAHDVATADITTHVVATADIRGHISRADITHDIVTVHITAADITTDDITTPNITSADITADITAADLHSPDKATEETTPDISTHDMTTTEFFF